MRSIFLLTFLGANFSFSPNIHTIDGGQQQQITVDNSGIKRIIYSMQGKILKRCREEIGTFLEFC